MRFSTAVATFFAVAPMALAAPLPGDGEETSAATTHHSHSHKHADGTHHHTTGSHHKKNHKDLKVATEDSGSTESAVTGHKYHKLGRRADEVDTPSSAKSVALASPDTPDAEKSVTSSGEKKKKKGSKKKGKKSKKGRKKKGKKGKKHGKKKKGKKSKKNRKHKHKKNRKHRNKKNKNKNKHGKKGKHAHKHKEGKKEHKDVEAAEQEQQQQQTTLSTRDVNEFDARDFTEPIDIDLMIRDLGSEDGQSIMFERDFDDAEFDELVARNFDEEVELAARDFVFEDEWEY